MRTKASVFFTSVKHVFFKANVEPDAILRFSSLVVYSVMCFILEVLRETFFLLFTTLPYPSAPFKIIAFKPQLA